MKAGHLFDGAGGMRLGFEQAGIETEWRLDLFYGQDITKTRTDELRVVELITGGPPCTHTSKAGSLSGVKTNQSLWPEMLRIVKKNRPKWTVVEQPVVDKSIIIRWVQDLQQSGYGVAGRIIDSRHWLPQQRSRWFIIGRLGVTGLALWNYLYPDSQRSEGRSAKGGTRQLYIGLCPDCMPSGIFARVSARIPALVGAGNAVSVPVARFIGERIVEAEREIARAKEHFGETE